MVHRNSQVTGTQRPGTVTVYTQKHCAPCLFTMRWLRDHDIVHRVVLVDVDYAARQRLRALGHRQTPVVVTPGGESWAGHNAGFLACLLPDADTTPDPTPASQASPGAAGPGGGTAGGRDVTPARTADRRVVAG